VRLDIQFLLLLLDDRLLFRDDHSPFAFHLDAGLSHLAFLVEISECHHPFTSHARFLPFLGRLLLQTLLLLGDCVLTLLNRAIHVFGAQANRFVGFQPLGFHLLTTRLNHLARLGFLGGLHFGHRPRLLGFILLIPTMLFALGDVGISILLLDLDARAFRKLVCDDPLALGDLGDLLDALGIKHVVRIMLVQRCLFEVIDGDILKKETIQILADGILDAIAERDAFDEQLVKLHLFTRGLQSLGKLGFEQLTQLSHVGDPLGRQHLGDLLHTVPGGIHPDVECHGDICADVILTDQAVLSLAGDLELLHRDVHDVVGLHERNLDHPVERDLQATPPGFYTSPARADLSNAERKREEAEEPDGDSKSDENVFHSVRRV